MDTHAARRDRLRRLMVKRGGDALLVTNFFNVTYLTGFTGDDSYLLLSRDGAILLSDRRYEEQLQEECPSLDLEIRGPGTKMLDWIFKVVRRGKYRRLGVEANSMTVTLFDALDAGLAKAQLLRTQGLVEQLRMVKDRDEVARIRRAAWQARRGFDVVRMALRPEQTELEVAAELEYQLRRFGAKGYAFPPIIAVGPRAALPHASPTAVRIGSSDFTLFDWGANEGLYLSDLTRLVVTGRISPKLQKVYGVVLKAQTAGIAAIRPGVTCAEVDAAARTVIEQAGYGKAFGHGLGHGIGLQVHEAPRFASDQSGKLRAGMVVTVEPGIYLPGWGGVRIEDDILVTRGGHEVLTTIPKQLEQCVVG